MDDHSILDQIIGQLLQCTLNFIGRGPGAGGDIACQPFKIPVAVKVMGLQPAAAFNKENPVLILRVKKQSPAFFPDLNESG
jgi:hypothetical protein